jgi:acetyl-CoA carboxylase biotin carboxylase subunit
VFEKILIANRGEIALRVYRACKEMGIQTVAVHSEADSKAMHVRLADESVCIGPSQSKKSYLNPAAIISAASITNSDAIHPGVGFLSESAQFARMVEDHGIAFIGPNYEHMKIMGNKIKAKEKMRELGLPVVPGSDGPVNDEDNAIKVAEEIGYPILVKASMGGGGKGLKIARDVDELKKALPTARSESKASFGNDEVYIEKFLPKPRHIEIQILADKHGHVIHLAERDCSIQRQRQKVIEEAPSPALNENTRKQICDSVIAVIKKLGYFSAGTVEFLYQDGAFYFIEMNTRLQVEHSVSEMISGVDIVRAQIRVANNDPLGIEQQDIKILGHAIECRINAEHPVNFTPSPGLVTEFHPPGGLDVRVDSALYTGYDVPPFYDSLVAKLIVRGRSRNACLMRLKRALEELVIEGINVNTPLHRKIISNPNFINGVYNINWLEDYLKK